MTDEELDAIEARLNAATPGPWVADPDRYSTPVTTMENCLICAPGHSRDAEFIAHAPKDIRLLLDEVRRLHKFTPY